MSQDGGVAPRGFHFRDLREVVGDLAGRRELAVEPTGRGLRTSGGGPELRVRLPLVLPGPLPEETVADWLARLPRQPGTQLVLLVQAGATAMGVWEGEDLLAHKVITKYVVRGKGRAQPAYRKTRGKSRLGSRLRLRGATQQLEETVARAQTWSREFGPFERVFLSCPVRTWAELRGDLAAVIPEPEGVTKVPLDVRVPRFEELLRVRRFLERGRVTLREPGDATP